LQHHTQFTTTFASAVPGLSHPSQARPHRIFVYDGVPREVKSFEMQGQSRSQISFLD